MKSKSAISWKSKRAFLGLHSSVGHLSYIGDATVGNYVNVGAGTIIANYDHATKEKARTTIGNGAATGSNSVLVAPVSLGDESFVGAGTVVTKRCAVRCSCCPSRSARKHRRMGRQTQTAIEKGKGLGRLFFYFRKSLVPGFNRGQIIQPLSFRFRERGRFNRD